MRRAVLPTPSTDLAELSERLGYAWGVSCGEPIAQYLAWSDRAGLFSLAAHRGTLTLTDIRANTTLTDEGIDALVGILVSLELLTRGRDGCYRLTALAREYFVEESPYYIGPGLYADCDKPLPEAFVSRSPVDGRDRPQPRTRWTVPVRLPIQHSRNFAPSVVAARSGLFDSVRHVVDIGGGSGTLAIPLALDRPGLRVTLVELPDALTDVHAMLARYGVDDRVELVGMNVLADSGSLPSGDCIFFGNFFHACTNEECRGLAARSFAALPVGGWICLHEVLFNEGRDGPLLAALWNANMVVRKNGARQRTASELMGILHGAGFADCHVAPTAARFSLVTGTRPPSGEVRH